MLHTTQCKGKFVNNFFLLENQFRYLVAGSYPKLKEQTSLLVQHSVVLHSHGNIEKFFEIENLGVSCQQKCGSCRCGSCHPARWKKHVAKGKGRTQID